MNLGVYEGQFTDRLVPFPVRFSYDIALLYLNQAKYDLDAAVEAYMADENWGKEHEMAPLSKGKTKQTLARRRVGTQTGLTGQI